MHIVVMGVSGCGKSHIGAMLADSLHYEFIDGDDLHPASNIEKMSAGIPLNDEDRKPWLEKIGTTLKDSPNTVIGCSALKRKYRDIIRFSAPDTYFLHLHGSEEILQQRMASRGSHFMKPGMLKSQLETLEMLDEDERGKIFDITQTPEAIVAAAIRELNS